MMPAAAQPRTVWSASRLDGRAGPAQLLFGRMHEDATLERRLFAAGARVLCIASAGCTALELSRHGYCVTAVDVNSAQVEYVRARMLGAPVCDGVIDRLMRRGRRMLALVGWTQRRVQAFLQCNDLTEQVSIWHKRSRSVRWRVALRLLLHPRRLQQSYARDFVAALPARFDGVMHRRLTRAFSRHLNRTNPFAWQLLAGIGLSAQGAAGTPVPRIHLECADVADYLERQAPGSFDAFSLSNVLDGVSFAHAERLRSAVRNAAAPGADLILRSLCEPRVPDEQCWASRDRALIWGAIVAGPVAKWTAKPARAFSSVARQIQEARS